MTVNSVPRIIRYSSSIILSFIFTPCTILQSFNPINFILISVVSIGVPIKLLHEGEGHVVTVELKNGETYRGMLTEAEDSMNCQMKEGNTLNISSFCFIVRIIFQVYNIYHGLNI